VSRFVRGPSTARTPRNGSSRGEAKQHRGRLLQETRNVVDQREDEFRGSRWLA
jgi:hypothetical protein